VKEYSTVAREIAPHEEDIPCFALALALNSPVWSNEKEFKSQSKIKVFSTSDMVNLLFKPM
jgi:predicted nucleic acid-binding protein